MLTRSKKQSSNDTNEPIPVSVPVSIPVPDEQQELSYSHRKDIKAAMIQRFTAFLDKNLPHNTQLINEFMCKNFKGAILKEITQSVHVNPKITSDFVKSKQFEHFCQTSQFDLCTILDHWVFDAIPRHVFELMIRAKTKYEIETSCRNGNTLLYYICYMKDNSKFIQLLVEKGVKFNIEFKHVDKEDNSSWYTSPLGIICGERPINIESLRILIQYGVNVNHRPPNNNYVIETVATCIDSNSVEAFQLLLDAGARLDYTSWSYNGGTLLTHIQKLLKNKSWKQSTASIQTQMEEILNTHLRKIGDC